MSIYTQKHQNQLKIVTISIHQNNRFRSDPKNFLASRVLVELAKFTPCNAEPKRRGYSFWIAYTRLHFSSIDETLGMHTYKHTYVHISTHHTHTYGSYVICVHIYIQRFPQDWRQGGNVSKVMGGRPNFSIFPALHRCTCLLVHFTHKIYIVRMCVCGRCFSR